MAIPLEALQDDVIYCVLSDAKQHEHVLMRGNAIRNVHYEGSGTAAPDALGLPEHYVLVKCPGERVQMAVWQDPSGPELIDDDAESPRLLSKVVEIPIECDGARMAEFNAVAETLESDGLVAAATDEIDKVLQTAADSLTVALLTPVQPKQRKPRKAASADVSAGASAQPGLQLQAPASPPRASPVPSLPAQAPVEEF